MIGSIIAYDILKHSFARINRYLDDNPEARQPKREELEALLRDPKVFSLEKLQSDCRKELNDLGNPWIVGDFVTLGSPLTHAEFLMAYDDDDMREQQQRRILPTCPPMLEWDSYHKQSCFTYWPDSSGRRNEHVRLPHHAAHFAFTRWTNIYSKSKDIVCVPERGVRASGSVLALGAHD